MPGNSKFGPSQALTLMLPYWRVVFKLRSNSVRERVREFLSDDGSNWRFQPLSDALWEAAGELDFYGGRLNVD